MLLGYNTNGLADHDPVEAVGVLAEIGYGAVGFSIDQHVLNPYADGLPRQIDRVRAVLTARGMRSVIETGARFLLDPWTKHEPTLMSPHAEDRQRRVRFYEHAIDIARELGSDGVSLWSGILRDTAEERAAFQRLAAGLEQVLDYATQRGVTIAFEPEPGMFIDTLARFERLLEVVNSPALKLTIDVGHLHCQGETPLAENIRRWGPRLANVHLEDMRRGVHEHLPFGEGEIEFPPVLAALEECHRGGVYVELSRHSYDGPNMARRAWEFLARGGRPSSGAK